MPRIRSIPRMGGVEEPRRAAERDEGTEDVKYTGLSIHLFAGCFGKRYGSGDADATCRRYTQRRRYRCRAITPLLRGTPRDVRRARCASASRTLSTLRINQARKREREGLVGGGGGEERKSFRVMHDAGHGMIRDIDA